MMTITEELIAATLRHLQNDGDRGVEGVVLWLGTMEGNKARVTEVYRPEQFASWGRFDIPRRSISALLRHLRANRTSIVAQVHSHPERAFHSPIDDEWAIVRHVGALSLVLPDFALETSADTFVEHTAVFELSPGNAWEEVLPGRVSEKYRITKS